MRTVIGLTGVKQSGKSTTANIIKKLYKTKEVALADKLKNVCSQAFKVPRNHFDDQDYKEQLFIEPKILTISVAGYILNQFNLKEPTVTDSYENTPFNTLLHSPREIAQKVGTELLRRYGGIDIHCENVKLSSGITVVSDMRFPNEYDYFANNSDIYFIPLYIDRKVAEDKVDPVLSHSSETSVFLFRDKCFKIDNNSTIKNLEKNLKNVLDTMLKR